MTIELRKSLIEFVRWNYTFIHLNSIHMTKRKKRKIKKLANDDELEIIEYSQLNWSKDDRQFNWKLLSILEENDDIKQRIWSDQSDKIKNISKIEQCERLTVKLLNLNSIYIFFIFNQMNDRTVRNQIVIRHYVNNIKTQFTALKKIWRKAHENLNETDQKLNNEKEIWNSFKLFTIWTEKIIKTCSYYYKMKIIVTSIHRDKALKILKMKKWWKEQNSVSCDKLDMMLSYLFDVA